VRRALALVINRPRIVERITRMQERPASHLVPFGTGGYTPPAGLEPDLPLARQLLVEAGYPGGAGFPPVEYAFNAESKLHEHIAVELQATFREALGVRIELRPLEWKTYLNNMSKLDYDMMRSSWIGDYNDPNTFLDLFLSNGGNNRTGWRDPEFDQLIHTANATLDRTRRFELLGQAEARLLRVGAPIVPLYSYVGFYALDTNRITGVHGNLLDEHPFWAIGRLPR
jgi:oligopeptide transport system substrate-binding protein